MAYDTELLKMFQPCYRRDHCERCGRCVRKSFSTSWSHQNIVTGSSKDIDVAVAAARKAFKTSWGKNVTGWERSRLINKLADLIERDAQELAELETLNNGKPVAIARLVLVCAVCEKQLTSLIETSISEIASSV